MSFFIGLIIVVIVIAKIIDYILLNHAFNIAKELGENPPASALVFGFVEDLFWQRIFEFSDDKQNKLLKKYITLHRIMFMVMMSGIAAIFMLNSIQYSK